MLAQVDSRGLLGWSSPPVTVEVHAANGLPAFSLVGLADTEVKEARERVRSAILNSGLHFPADRRLTVNLAPADLPKDSGRFDLPLALGVLAASGQIPLAALAGWQFAGELSLSGELRPIRGALLMGLALHAQGGGGAVRLLLPQASAAEAARAPGVSVWQASHLCEVVAALRGEAPWQVATPSPWRTDEAPAPPDLRDVRGQAGARRALEIAAAGGHSLLLVGPPGTGKTLLAQRLAGLCPPMTEAQALESAALLGLSGAPPDWQWARRVTRSPHHTVSLFGLIGGGVPARPGEVSLAHGGVLFLDELPLFARATLESLREPLESGWVSVSRATSKVSFPARFQLVAAMNPCPCGYLGATHRACRCTPDQVARYQGRLSGPLLERIDLQVEVPLVDARSLTQLGEGESSAVVQARCRAAHARALDRQGGVNAHLEAGVLVAQMGWAPATETWFQHAVQQLGWSGRATHRVLRVARTIADLAASPSVERDHLAEAIQYRRVLVV